MVLPITTITIACLTILPITVLPYTPSFPSVPINAPINAPINVLVPLKNEQCRMENFLQGVREEWEGGRIRLYLVDDYSDDDTWEGLREFKRSVGGKGVRLIRRGWDDDTLGNNTGCTTSATSTSSSSSNSSSKGGGGEGGGKIEAVMEGINAGLNEGSDGVVIIVDGDGSISFPEALNLCLNTLTSPPQPPWLITGYRSFPTLPFPPNVIPRLILRAGFRSLVSSLFPGLRGIDSQTGIKVFDSFGHAGYCYDGVKGWGGDVEVCYRAKESGWVGTVKVDWVDKEGGSLLDGGLGGVVRRSWEMAVEVFKFRLRVWRGEGKKWGRMKKIAEEEEEG